MIKSNNYISNLHCEFDLKGFPASSDPLLAVQTPALLPMEELLLRKEGSGKSLCRLSVRTCQALRANLPALQSISGYLCHLMLFWRFRPCPRDPRRLHGNVDRQELERHADQ